MLAAMVDDSFMEGFIFVGIKVGLMWNASYLSFRSYYIFLYVDCSSILRASSIMDGLSIECFIRRYQSQSGPHWGASYLFFLSVRIPCMVDYSSTRRAPFKKMIRPWKASSS